MLVHIGLLCIIQTLKLFIYFEYVTKEIKKKIIKQENIKANIFRIKANNSIC